MIPKKEIDKAAESQFTNPRGIGTGYQSYISFRNGIEFAERWFARNTSVPIPKDTYKPLLPEEMFSTKSSCEQGQSFAKYRNFARPPQKLVLLDGGRFKKDKVWLSFDYDFLLPGDIVCPYDPSFIDDVPQVLIIREPNKRGNSFIYKGVLLKGIVDYCYFKEG